MSEMTAKKGIKLSQSQHRIIGGAVKGVFLTIICLLVLVPLVWMIITSIKPSKEMYTFPIIYFPRHPTLENYNLMFTYQHVWQNMLNTVYISLAGPLFTVLLATPAAYVLNRLRFPGRRLVWAFFLATQMLPGSMVAMYIFMAKIHMLDNLTTLVFMGGAGGVTFGIMVLQGFFGGIPYELEESAMIDGCNRYNSFLKIVLPLLKGGVFTVFIFQFISMWNDSYTAILYINTAAKKTLAATIYAMVGQYDTNWGQVAAATTISLIPTVVLFSVMKDVFVEGITAGSVKG